MNEGQDFTLERALDRLLAGEQLDMILADCPDQAALLAPALRSTQLIMNLQSVELPSQIERDRDRQAFLLQAAQYLAVQESLVHRSKSWLLTGIKQWFPSLLLTPSLSSLSKRKETHPMFFIFAKAALILTLLLGAGGGSLAAATANSLPDTPFYPLKLAYEHFRLDLTQDPLLEANFHLTRANTRVNEFIRQVERGEIPNQDLTNQVEIVLLNVLEIGNRLQDDDLKELLLTTRAFALNQDRQLDQLQLPDWDRDLVRDSYLNCKQLLSRIREVAETGIQDPQAFRFNYANGWNEPGPHNEDVPNQSQNQYGPGPSNEDPPAGEGNQNQYGPGPHNEDPPADEGDQNQ
jgi:hypothetical protein